MFAICGRGFSAAQPLPCLVDVGQPDWALSSLPPRGRGSGSAVPLNEACQMEKNAIIAAVLSLAVLIGWQMLVLQPMQEKGRKRDRSEKPGKKAPGKKRARPPRPCRSRSRAVRSQRQSRLPRKELRRRRKSRRRRSAASGLMWEAPCMSSRTGGLGLSLRAFSDTRRISANLPCCFRKSA